jgi:hypothetical protein
LRSTPSKLNGFWHVRPINLVLFYSFVKCQCDNSHLRIYKVVLEICDTDTPHNTHIFCNCAFLHIAMVIGPPSKIIAGSSALIKKWGIHIGRQLLNTTAVCWQALHLIPSSRPFVLGLATYGHLLDLAARALALTLTAKSVPARTKNSRPVGFYGRNSTKSTLHHKHNNPQTLPPWWCRLPLIWRGIYGSARSDARKLFQRGRAGGGGSG